MFNLKNLFRSNPCLLTFAKAEKELLECFFANRQEFEHWLSLQPQQRIRFQFYYPTAVDFYFDEFQLFTAFFKRTSFDTLELAELKMTTANYTTIRSANWKPFEDVIMQFLQSLEEKNKIRFFQKTRSLHEYASICNETVPVNKEQPKSSFGVNPFAAG